MLGSAGSTLRTGGRLRPSKLCEVPPSSSPGLASRALAATGGGCILSAMAVRHRWGWVVPCLVIAFVPACDPCESKEREITNHILAQSCKADSDCVASAFHCPFSCLVVRRDSVEKLRTRIKAHRKACPLSTCTEQCGTWPHEPKCREGRCRLKKQRY